MQILNGAKLRAHNYFLSLSLNSGKWKRSFLMLCILLTSTVAMASHTDTLGYAKQLRSEGKLKEAAGWLKAYHANHSTDLNSSWIYAQTLYWLKDFKKAESIYHEAILAHPNNYYLQLDYVNVLVALGNTKSAKPLLSNYRTFDSTSAGFKSAVADLYWSDKKRKAGEIVYRNFAPTAADTLKRVKQLKGEARIRDSYKLIKTYYGGHSSDLNTTWLFGQIAYLDKHFKQSKKLYKKVIAAHPDNYYLKLDYAKTLVDFADYKEAKPLLSMYRGYDSANLEMRLDFAKVYLAEGEYDKAKKEINVVLAKDGKNSRALALLDELHAAQASWIKIMGNYNFDSQPLQTITPTVDAGVYLHPEASLRLNLQTPLFISNGSLKNAQWLQIGDQSAFRKAGFQFSYDAGVVKQPYLNKISWTGNLELKQLLFKHFVLQAQAERKPYYYTLGSLDTVIVVNRFSAYAEWNDLNSWNGHIAFELNQFPDKNYTIGGNGWVFTPPLKVSVLEFRVGYAYSYSTSKSNGFVPENTLAQIIANYSTTTDITGVYSPYFTPDNMSVHSALVSIVAHPAKIFDLGFNANVGFYATALTPYFYLNKNASEATYIAEGYATEKFYPMEFSAYALVRISKKISLKADYTYRKTYFYTSNTVGLGLKINFWNEQKGK